jgi:16S rRNA G966 N2-methylase RsmD
MDNKQLLKAEQASVRHQDALQFLSQNPHKFNIIFLDPPYNQGLLAKVLPLLPPHLNPDGFVYAEAEYAIEPDDVWQVVKQSKAGNVFYHLLKLHQN